jgi:hypothetical protein
MEYIVGIDLGQLRDRSALSVIECKREAAALTYECRWLEVWNPGILHKRIVDDVVWLVEQIAPPPTPSFPNLDRRYWPKGNSVRAIVDITVVGTPIGLMFYDALREVGVRCDCVVITQGTQVERKDQPWRVPKRDLVSVMRVLLESNRIKFAPNMEHREELIKELSNFKIDKETGDDNQIDWRVRDSDDLVLATALACWASEHGRPKYAQVR